MQEQQGTPLQALARKLAGLQSCRVKLGHAKSASSSIYNQYLQQAEAVRSGMTSRLFRTVDKRLLSHESEQKQSLFIVLTLGTGQRSSLQPGNEGGTQSTCAVDLHACRQCTDDSIFAQKWTTLFHIVCVKGYRYMSQLVFWPTCMARAPQPPLFFVNYSYIYIQLVIAICSFLIFISYQSA